MADAARHRGGKSERTETDREIPVPGFNEITFEQAAKRLRRLTPDKLRRVRAYEVAHKNRGTVLAAIDRLLEGQL
jgi:hypothetical protein